MSDVARPVPEDGVMDQDEQASLLVRTGDGVAVPDEEAELTAEWGEPDANGVYALPEFVSEQRKGDDA
ncbi:hypothetical protein SEA_MARKY_34 [Streptomyces phage Marky]|nr:hypothetical protein SEA_MARKY_34 [Streptomyces phage Marky]